ncbi:MAG: RlmE family RNA methyltransferase [Deltaproteobacteria bacterium]|jgi:23S rRNA (uridine2552-2'-O)-methyltransferase|nr:RlmE family RNA methyltransferase [Deltaproteobacteria bacterium]MBW2536408.1 RlmE family RNA methyltransferase [Deltaproteobacteria bacterium]
MGRKRRSPYRGADHRSRAARAAGYPARSVFKLSEIDRRVRLLRQGQHVLDLGAAPGSWSAYAAERVGGNGRVVAVDLQEMRTALGPNCTVLQADALDLDAQEIARFAPYDVVLSDMAPNTCGDKSTDQWRSYHLFAGAVAAADRWLAEGGSFVGKLFMGASYEEARQSLRERFDKVRTIRPQGTRRESYEVFLVGLTAKRSGQTPEPSE